MRCNRAYLSVFILLLAIVSQAFVLPVAAQHEGHQTTEHKEQKGSLWTCSMHPHIRLPKPGKCPICNMDLIPIDSGEGKREEAGEGNVTVSPEASVLMEIQTTPVEQKWIERAVRLVGRIDYDETRLRHITAWVPGRIERMFVDYSGIVVREGDHMVSVYSPELVSAQEELIQASRSLARIKGGSEMVRRSTRRSLSAARDKLKLLGLTPKQVAEIERRGNAEDSVTIYSPMGGTVVEKVVNEGMYVQTGTRIYTIADLSHLWLILDAYESDISWLAYGQDVAFNAEALPGENFNGVVSFIQPVVDEKTRTVKVRVNVENPSKRLKPGMFVTARVKARIDQKGKVITESYEEKYLCPMHPEVVREEKGSCPVCGMNLVQATTLPFVNTRSSKGAKPPLVIPVSAPLITGKRAVVYVKVPEQGKYQAREVLLGPKAGDYYIVREGLRQGELVVTKGAFKLDADLQIRGAQSMMNPGMRNQESTEPGIIEAIGHGPHDHSARVGH